MRQNTKSKKLSSTNYQKHCVSIENSQWDKLQRFANESNVTISYILNELIKGVEKFENRSSFGMQQRDCKKDNG